MIVDLQLEFTRFLTVFAEVAPEGSRLLRQRVMFSLFQAYFSLNGFVFSLQSPYPYSVFFDFSSDCLVLFLVVFSDAFQAFQARLPRAYSRIQFG